MNFKKYTRILMFIIILGLISIPLGGCKSGIPSEFNRNEKLWKSRQITDYNFTLQRNCFCPEDRRGPVTIQVRDDLPTSVVYTESGATANSDFFSDADTIGELFAVLKNAYIDKAVQVDVKYDATYSYPVSIYIDISQQIADEEQGYEITNLEVIHVFGNPK